MLPTEIFVKILFKFPKFLIYLVSSTSLHLFYFQRAGNFLKKNYFFPPSECRIFAKRTKLNQKLLQTLLFFFFLLFPKLSSVTFEQHFIPFNCTPKSSTFFPFPAGAWNPCHDALSCGELFFSEETFPNWERFILENWTEWLEKNKKKKGKLLPHTHKWCNFSLSLMRERRRCTRYVGFIYAAPENRD